MVSFVVGSGVSHAQEMPPGKRLITSEIIRTLRGYLTQDIVVLSIRNQNVEHAALTSEQVDALDKKWRSEHKQDKKPLISGVLSNPLSGYLTRLQAHSLGLYSEIFLMDNKGLNVGQSNISSDFWQGDEGKWQKTFLVGSDAVFIDDPEWHAESRTWRVQVNLAIADPTSKQAIGAATFELNLTELQRRGGI